MVRSFSSVLLPALGARGQPLDISQNVAAKALMKDFREQVVAATLAKMNEQSSGEAVRWGPVVFCAVSWGSGPFAPYGFASRPY